MKHRFNSRTIYKSNHDRIDKITCTILEFHKCGNRLYCSSSTLSYHWRCINTILSFHPNDETMLFHPAQRKV